MKGDKDMIDWGNDDLLMKSLKGRATISSERAISCGRGKEEVYELPGQLHGRFALGC